MQILRVNSAKTIQDRPG